MSNESAFYKNEYENLRRKKNKEIQDLKLKQADMVRKTLILLKLFHIPNEEIIDFYRRYK